MSQRRDSQERVKRYPEIQVQKLLSPKLESYQKQIMKRSHSHDHAASARYISNKIENDDDRRRRHSSHESHLYRRHDRNRNLSNSQETFFIFLPKRFLYNDI